jgi:RHS repeat-associated protein
VLFCSFYFNGILVDKVRKKREEDRKMKKTIKLFIVLYIGCFSLKGQSENELYFYHGDHLSSTQLVTDINANVTQQIFYAPFGEVISETNAYWHNGQIHDYMFNAKELDEENGMYYYSDRYYAPPVFTSRDPLFEEYFWMSPYAYCGNNSVSRIDPDGCDWVESQGGQIVWNDNATSKENTPKDCKYIGPKSTDILTHLGVSERYEMKSDVSRGVGFVGGRDKNVGPAGQGIPGGTIARVEGYIGISANISYNKENATDNNKAGITFDGISVTAHVTERSASSSSDLNSRSGGTLSVSLSKNGDYESSLASPTGSYMYETGTKQTTATVNIPANKLSSSNYLQSATIRIGRPNPSIIYSKPTDIKWQLQTIPMYRNSK